MGHRLFDDDELAALARPYRDRVADAIERAAAGSPDDPAAALTTLVAGIERRQARFVDGFHRFVAAIEEWLALESPGSTNDATDTIEQLAALDRAVHESTLLDLATYGMPDDLQADGPARIAELATAGNVADALALFHQRQDALRRRHDVAVDRVAAALSWVYRTFGVDQLESCLRHCGARTLLGWMPHDVARPLDVRIRQWVELGLANFATLRVEESDDEVVIVQDPCGTCSRQVLQGVYGPPLDFAVVEERHPITWQRGDTPVYRTHVAVMHDLMPRELTGRPWPRIECPLGVSAGPCRQRFEKAPAPVTPAG
ncbi:MAG TPA: hypothetical protein VF183_16980 [Acidimicrobiales bacterium]